jgi:hypothetical protein
LFGWRSARDGIDVAEMRGLVVVVISIVLLSLGINLVHGQMVGQESQMTVMSRSRFVKFIVGARLKNNTRAGRETNLPRLS